MVVSDTKLANVMGGKTARACDNCISKRARWYCPADDAFLCQGCDSSVHSANPLARRHERVCLKTASMKHQPRKMSMPPSWHRGFTKKARTPRNKKHAKPMFEEASSSSGVNVNPLDFVPELCSDDNSYEENDEQLLYRVPIFDPFVQELCNDHSNSNEGATNTSPQIEIKGTQSYSLIITDSNQLHGSLPSEIELQEFAADVESLLGKGLDDESFDIEGLGFSGCKDQIEENSCGSGQIKVEDGGETAYHDQVYGEIHEMGREAFEISLDFDSSMACEDDYNNVQLGDNIRENCKVEEGSMNMITSGNKILLRLDYEGVMTSWADQKSPWTTGERPELDPYGCWPVCIGSCGTVHPYGDVGIFGHPAIVDGGREARVSRYREKRRTRLFSKKIRYEVRKLNAEKRPRMKGRFVKRANLSASPAFPPHSK